MDVFAAVNRFISLYVDTFKQLGRGRIWLLLVGYFLLNGLLLYAHYNFLSPLFYGFISFWTSLFHDQQAGGFTHYPGHFILLPHFFGWAKFFLGMILEGAILGAVALIFYDSFLDIPRAERSSTRTLFSSWVHLVLSWVLINGLILLVNLELPKLLKPLLVYSPRRIQALEFVLLPLLYIVVLALFFFMLPRVAIYRESFLRALKGALRMFIRNPITCFSLSLVLLTVPIFISFISNHATEIVEKFKPEVVYWILLAGLVADALFYFFWMGTAVRFLVEEES